MRPFTLALLFVCALGLSSCETTQVVHHKARVLPPEIQKAQDEVWNLQYQLYQAQHDLNIAQLNQKEFELQNQKNSNPGAYAAQYMDLYSKIEFAKTRTEQRYDEAQQWYQAVQSGDMDSAKLYQDQMNQP